MIKYLCALVCLCSAIVVSSANAQDWSWPGDLKTHLANDHGVFVGDMSPEEMTQIHNELHEGTFESGFVDGALYTSISSYPQIEVQENNPDMVQATAAPVVVYMYSGEGPIRRLVRKAYVGNGPVRRMLRRVWADGPVRRMFRFMRSNRQFRFGFFRW